MAKAPETVFGYPGSENLDLFTAWYIKAALWSSTDETDDQGGEPLDKNYNLTHIHPDTLAKMVADCAKFQADNADTLTKVFEEYTDLDSGDAGYDFWLTRNGHGAGFWDGDWPEDTGDTLTAASKAHGEYHLYVENGKVYGYSG